jgi:hypothetical protein
MMKAQQLDTSHFFLAGRQYHRSAWPRSFTCGEPPTQVVTRRISLACCRSVHVSHRAAGANRAATHDREIEALAAACRRPVSRAPDALDYLGRCTSTPIMSLTLTRETRCALAVRRGEQMCFQARIWCAVVETLSPWSRTHSSLFILYNPRPYSVLAVQTIKILGRLQAKARLRDFLAHRRGFEVGYQRR